MTKPELALHSEVVAELVPRIYARSVSEFRYHPGTDMSRSAKCHTLTVDLLAQLSCLDIIVRRELHQTESGLWHYVVAHTEIDAEPSDEDVITDLNPWRFPEAEGTKHSGYLHARRSDVTSVLSQAGAPEDYMELSTTNTIVLSHTERLLPDNLRSTDYK